MRRNCNWLYCTAVQKSKHDTQDEIEHIELKEVIGYSPASASVKVIQHFYFSCLYCFNVKLIVIVAKLVACLCGKAIVAVV